MKSEKPRLNHRVDGSNPSRRRGAGLLAIAALVIGGLFARDALREPRDGMSVVVYSGRREPFVVPVLERFGQTTGIRVQLLSGNATSFAHRLIEERRRPAADIFLANDAGVMEYLRRQGVLEPIDAPGTENIPPALRAGDRSWVGLSARVRVLMYHRDRLPADDLPQSVFDLADPRYRGRFAVTRAGNSSLISHMAALRTVEGDARSKEFLRDMLDNDPFIAAGHTDIRRMVGRGEVEIGLVNCYYYRLQRAEPRHHHVGVIYPDQAPDQSGAFVNVAGVAKIRNGPNADAAGRLLAFLLEPEQMRWFAELSLETPILPGHPAPGGGRPLDEIKIMPMSLSELGAVWEDTLAVMEQSGYAE